MTRGPGEHPWWERGVIYQIYPRSFQDSDGDGIGDLAGIKARLDYVADLGVDAIWLSPIFPSPMADFGYDVADYCAVEPMFGDLAAFDRLLAAVHVRGLKLLLDFVPNHSFGPAPLVHRQPVASSRIDARRDWYIWRDSGAGRGAAQQLDQRLRRLLVGVGRCDRAILPACLSQAAARSELAQP